LRLAFTPPIRRVNAVIRLDESRPHCGVFAHASWNVACRDVIRLDESRPHCGLIAHVSGNDDREVIRLDESRPHCGAGAAVAGAGGGA